MIKKYYVTVNGNRYEVEVEEVKGEFDKKEEIVNIPSEPVKQQVKKEEVKKEIVKEESKQEQNVVSGEGEAINCPMPGTILNINVNVGDTVKKGQVLFILEAMKMENEIMASRDGVITAIAVSKGASANTGDLLAKIK